MSRTGDTPDPLRRARDAVLAGDYDALARPEGAAELGRALAALAGDPRRSEAERSEAGARHAQLLLLRGDRKDAVARLGPLGRADGDAVAVDADACDDLELRVRRGGCDPLAAGVLLAQAAHAAYRLFDHATGIRAARRAEACLDQGAPTGQGTLRALELEELRTWLARLLWRHEQHAEAEALLRETVARLEQLAASDERRGFDLVWAHALDFWAYVDWTRGRYASARQRIYQSLYLHQRARCPIRRGHALYIAGRIEGTAGGPHLATAERLLAEAEELLRAHAHPSFARAAVQRVHTSCKALRIDEARERIGAVRAVLDDRRLDADEVDYVRADLRLAELWLAEHAAREPAGGAERRRRWEACLELARALRAGPGPSRLELEGRLHEGIALAELDRPEADATLREALRRAEEQQRSKVRIAAHFALCELALRREPPSESEAASWLEAGARALADVESGFLRDWHDRLRRRIATAPIVVRIPPEASLHEARRIVDRETIRYHLARHDNNQLRTARRLGLSRQHLNKRIGELGLRGA